MAVPEGSVDSLVKVTVVDLVGAHAGRGSRDLPQLAAQILALLVCALGGRREGGELVVDLVEEFGQFAEVERAGLVFVVLFEEAVEAAEMVGRLREALLDARCDVSPFAEGEVQLLRVFAFLPGDGAEEGDDVVGDVVLDGCAVADGVDVA